MKDQLVLIEESLVTLKKNSSSFMVILLDTRNVKVTSHQIKEIMFMTMARQALNQFLTWKYDLTKYH